MIGLLLRWALAFVATLLLELPVYARLLPGRPGLRGAFRRVLAVNLITHPALVTVVLALGLGPAGILLAEAVVVGVEGRLLAVEPAERGACLRASLAANALSYATGRVLLG